MLFVLVSICAIAVPCTIALCHAALGNRQERRRLELARQRA